MKTIILLCAMFLSSINIFAQNSKDSSREIYISQPTSYGEFVLQFVVVENGLTISHPSFRIKYNKKGLKKIADKGFFCYVDCKVSYLNNGNIYIRPEGKEHEYYTTENFNNYLYEKFRANEGANFLNRLLHPKEAYLIACPNFFEMTNEERLEYFLNHVEK